MAEKVTEMRLKVDLQCPCCYKKVKKLLCKFPQIRDQVYDEKNNIVKIVVVSCSPENIRDKLCCKGGKVIKCIEIVQPPPTTPQISKPPPSQPPPSQQPPKGQETSKPRTQPAADTSKPGTQPVVREDKPDDTQKPKEVSVQAFLIGVCGRQCYEGYPRGPCCQGYGRPVPPPPCYDRYGYPYGCGYNRGCYVCRCNQYCSDGNPSTCSIM